MDKKDYLSARQKLYEEAQALVNNNEIENANAKMDEIKKLDADFENAAKAKANLDALQNQNVASFYSAGTKMSFSEVSDKLDLAGKPENKADDIYKNAFAKTLMGEMLNEQEAEIFDKANSDFKNEVHTVQQGAILVPKTLQQEIFRVASETHPILNEMRDYNVKGNLSIIVDKPVSQKDLWTDENTETNDTQDADFQEVTLSGCELPKGTKVSWKMKKMSIDDFMNYIVEKLAEKVGDALAYSIFNGKGKPSTDENFKPQPLGIITALEKEQGTPQVVEYTDADDLNTKVKNTISKIKSAYMSFASIYANNSFVWNVLANIKDKNGREYFIADATSGGVGRIFGLVVKEEDAVPDDCMTIAAAGKCYALNTSEPMSITHQDLAQKRQTYYGAYTIVDGAPITTKGFALMKKTVTPAKTSAVTK